LCGRVDDNLFMVNVSPQTGSTPSSLSKAPHIIFVTPGKLGDGLISLVIANNLVRSGYRVTVRSNVVHDLSSWFPQFQTGPEVGHGEFPDLPNACDLCVIDSQAPNLQHQGIDLRPALARRAVFFSLAHYETPLDGLFDPSTLPKNLRHRLESLVPRHGLVRNNRMRKADMVAHALAFCRREMGLKDTTSDIGIVAPPLTRSTSQKPSQKARIVISPTSGKVKKNWRAERFVAVAASLEKRDYEVIFAVAPSEKSEWAHHLDGRFLIADTQGVADLAMLLTGAKAVIANDSGTAHLASALGKPVVCIISSRNRFFSWRPGWREAVLVYPRVPVRSIARLWPYCVSRSRVLRETQNVLEQDLEMEKS